MTKWLMTLVVLLVLAVPLAAQRRRTVIVVPGQTTQIISDTMGSGYDLPYSYGKVYHALVATFAELKIVTTAQDSLEGQVGNLQFITSSPLAGKPMSAYLSCNGGITGPYADTYRIYLSIMSYLTPGGPNDTTLHTGLLGTAVNVAEGSRQAMPCETTGRLELRVYETILKKLTGL